MIKRYEETITNTYNENNELIETVTVRTPILIPEENEVIRNKLTDEILLSVYRFALLSVKYGVADKDWFEIDYKDGDVLASRILDRMFSAARPKDKATSDTYESEPEFLKTVIRSSEELIRERYEKMLGK